MKCVLLAAVIAAAAVVIVGSDDAVELLDGKQSDSDKKGENYQRASYNGGYGGGHGGGGYGGQDGYYEGGDYGTVRTTVQVRRRILRPLRRKKHYGGHGGHHRYNGRNGYGGFEGSYVAVSGRPGERTVHAVNGGRSISIQPGHHAVVDHGYDYDLDGGYGGGRRGIEHRGGHGGHRGGHAGSSGLPRCSYFATDFYGNDVGDGRGLTTGSPYACKAACVDNDGCQFWTFREGWARDCYLKRGDADDDVTPDNVNRKEGFISGTLKNNCRCLRDGDGDRICPTRRSGAPPIPWNQRGRGYGPRFDYDDDYDYDDDDDGDREVATKIVEEAKVEPDEVPAAKSPDSDNGGGGRRRRNRNRNRNNNNNNADGNNSGGGGRRNRRRNRNQNSKIESPETGKLTTVDSSSDAADSEAKYDDDEYYFYDEDEKDYDPGKEAAARPRI